MFFAIVRISVTIKSHYDKFSGSMENGNVKKVNILLNTVNVLYRF